MGIGGGILGGLVGLVISVGFVLLYNTIMSGQPTGPFSIDTGLIVMGTTAVCAIGGLIIVK